MNQAKTIFAFLGIFTFIILSIGLVSADAEAHFTNVNGNDISINPGDSVSINFTISNDHSTKNFTNITIDLPDFSSMGIWSAASRGTTSLTISNNQIDLEDFVVLNGTESEAFIIDFETDNVASAGDTTGEINLNGLYNYTGSPPNPDPISLLVTVNAVSSLEITPSSQTINYGYNATISLDNTGNTNLDDLVLSETTSFGATFSTIASSLAAGASDTITVILDSLTGIKFGTNTLTILANDTTQPEANDTATITIKKTFCDLGEVGGNLTIDKIDIDNLDGSNDEWSILDEIELEVKVENSNSDEYDLEDIVIELGFYDSDGNNIADELEYIDGADSDGLTDDFDLDEGDDKTITIKFKIPADFEKGNYKLAVKTYSEDLDEDNECADSSSDLTEEFYEDISIKRESDDEKSIIVEDISFDNSEVTCGQTVTGEFTVYNIGTDSQEKILIVMENSAFDLDEHFEVLNDMDEGDDGETFVFSFEVPENVEDENYKIGFTTYSDYDSDGDADYFEFYKDRSDEIFYETLKVIGCESNEEESVLISAELDSEAEAGEELIVTSTITNLGDEISTFAIDVTGFEEWAELVSLSEEVATLASGESKEITITLNVNEDIEGTQTFVIETNSNGNLEVQQVEVNIAESTGFGGLGIILKNSGMLWLIGIINIVLIFLVILVAVRLSRR